MNNDNLVIAGKEFSSRLFVGTGKFSSADVMSAAIKASESEMVTVALRRVNISDPGDNMLEKIDTQKCQLLPNTSGARDADEAIRVAMLSREASGNNWIKLEVTPDPYYLLPDPIETLKATEKLVKEGFIVLPYINADPILALHLQDAGASTVMPLGSPIGSNQGIKTRANIEIIIEQAHVPVVVDAGIGLPSHATEAMEMGADAVLVNTALAVASDPIQISIAFKLAVQAGRMAFLSGPGSIRKHAEASSPLTGFLA